MPKGLRDRGRRGHRGATTPSGAQSDARRGPRTPGASTPLHSGPRAPFPGTRRGGARGDSAGLPGRGAPEPTCDPAAGRGTPRPLREDPQGPRGRLGRAPARGRRGRRGAHLVDIFREPVHLFRARQRHGAGPAAPRSGAGARAATAAGAAGAGGQRAKPDQKRGTPPAAAFIATQAPPPAGPAPRAPITAPGRPPPPCRAAARQPAGPAPAPPFPLVGSGDGRRRGPRAG